MALPLLPLALLALPFLGKAGSAAKDNPTPLLIGIGALFFLSKWSFDQIPFDEIKEQLDIRPETNEFLEGLFNVDPGRYADDQTGSPNPPPLQWWESPETDDQLPIPTTRVAVPGQQTRILGDPPEPYPMRPGSWAVPTAPVIEGVPNPTSPARVAGQATNDWFAKPWLYGWFAGFEKVLQSAPDRTNSDRFWDEG